MRVLGDDTGSRFHRDGGNPDVVRGNGHSERPERAQQGSIPFSNAFRDRLDFPPRQAQESFKLPKVGLRAVSHCESVVQLTQHDRGDDHLIRGLQQAADLSITPLKSGVGVCVQAERLILSKLQPAC